MRTDKGYRACSLSLGKRNSFCPKCCSWRRHKSTPQRAQIMFGSKWETTFLVTLGWQSLAALGSTFPRWKASSSSRWVEYVMSFHSEKLNPHILQKQEVVLCGLLGKECLVANIKPPEQTWAQYGSPRGGFLGTEGREATVFISRKAERRWLSCESGGSIWPNLCAV